MSNFIIRQEGPSSVVADNIWEIRLVPCRRAGESARHSSRRTLSGKAQAGRRSNAAGLAGQFRPQGRSQNRPREHP